MTASFFVVGALRFVGAAAAGAVFDDGDDLVALHLLADARRRCARCRRAGRSTGCSIFIASIVTIGRPRRRGRRRRRARRRRCRASGRAARGCRPAARAVEPRRACSARRSARLGRRRARACGRPRRSHRRRSRRRAAQRVTVAVARRRGTRAAPRRSATVDGVGTPSPVRMPCAQPAASVARQPSRVHGAGARVAPSASQQRRGDREIVGVAARGAAGVRQPVDQPGVELARAARRDRRAAPAGTRCWCRRRARRSRRAARRAARAPRARSAPHAITLASIGS